MSEKPPIGPGGGEGVLGLIFAGYVPLVSQSPYPIMVFSARQICNFRDPNLVTFYFLWIDPFFRLNEEHFTFNLQYKHSGTFANRKYQELSCPKKSENVPPHSSNSIENATPL